MLHQSDYPRGSGSIGAFKACKCCFKPNSDAWADIEEPTPGDWLAEHVESTPDQTFSDYVMARPNRPDASRHTICLQLVFAPGIPFSHDEVGRAGTFPQLASLEAAAAAFFQMPVRWLSPIAMESLRPNVTSREARGFGTQWHAREVLSALRVPRDAFCLLAITMCDLYPRPEWNFVYGLANLSSRVGVFSFVRHDPCAGRRDRGQEEESQLLFRSTATLLHEVGHMFGLKHCTWFNCLMRGNNGDGVEHQRAPLHLCPVCLRKLHWNVGFDIVIRYKDLLEVYDPLCSDSSGFEEEVSFLRNRLEALQDLPPTSFPGYTCWKAFSKVSPDRDDSAAAGVSSHPKHHSTSSRLEANTQNTAHRHNFVPGSRARSSRWCQTESSTFQSFVAPTVQSMPSEKGFMFAEAVEAIYLEKAPEHAPKLARYLARYQGREDKLYATVCKTYGVEPVLLQDDRN